MNKRLKIFLSLIAIIITGITACSNDKLINIEMNSSDFIFQKDESNLLLFSIKPSSKNPLLEIFSKPVKTFPALYNIDLNKRNVELINKLEVRNFHDVKKLNDENFLITSSKLKEIAKCSYENFIYNIKDNSLKNIDKLISSPDKEISAPFFYTNNKFLFEDNKLLKTFNIKTFQAKNITKVTSKPLFYKLNNGNVIIINVKENDQGGYYTYDTYLFDSKTEKIKKIIDSFESWGEDTHFYLLNNINGLFLQQKNNNKNFFKIINLENYSVKEIILPKSLQDINLGYIYEEKDDTCYNSMLFDNGNIVFLEDGFINTYNLITNNLTSLKLPDKFDLSTQIIRSNDGKIMLFDEDMGSHVCIYDPETNKILDTISLDINDNLGYDMLIRLKNGNLLLIYTDNGRDMAMIFDYNKRKLLGAQNLVYERCFEDVGTTGYLDLGDNRVLFYCSRCDYSGREKNSQKPEIYSCK